MQSIRFVPPVLVLAVLAVLAPIACGDDPVGPPDDESPIVALSTAASPGRTTSDLWVHGDHVYTGTWAAAGPATTPGNALFVWDITRRDAPVLVDSVLVDAQVVNDVKVSPDGSLAVLTHEGSSDDLNGVTFLDLAEPGHPEVIGRYTEGLEAGVHNTWLEDDYAYVVVDGFGGGQGGLRILDVTDPGNPLEVADFPAEASSLHDVYVRDGLAFLSHWSRGLVILDVGHGIAGGDPTSPAFVSRIEDLGGETHNAWYWPEAGYVFVGEEDDFAPGIMRVVDVSDLLEPRQVATFGVPGDTPHNFWLDEEKGILYLAWYTKGVRALDVNGQLSGELELQDREIAVGTYGPGDGWCTTGPGPTCTWAPQLHDGHLYLSDLRQGLVVATPAG